MTASLAQLPPRVRSKIAVTESGCWEWTAGKGRRGYGQASVNRRPKAAHRVVYMLLVGPIAEGLHLDHLCRNPPCVNPAHLEPVTPAVNNARSSSPSAQNSRKSECIHGHPFSEENTYFYPYMRLCKTCNIERQRARRARQRAEEVAQVYGLVPLDREDDAS